MDTQSSTHLFTVRESFLQQAIISVGNINRTGFTEGKTTEPCLAGAFRPVGQILRQILSSRTNS